MSGLFSGKTVTEDDLVKSSKTLSEHLINKNVAPEIAQKLVERINKSLIGTKVTTSIPKAARNALEKELLKLLTPETSINLLKEIQSKRLLESHTSFLLLASTVLESLQIFLNWLSGYLVTSTGS